MVVVVCDRLTAVPMDVATFFDGVLQKIMFMRNDHVGDVQIFKNVDETVLGCLIQAGGRFIQ